MAVECDGEAFHTEPDDVHNDLVRQRQLERCGWTFWRISDSEFYWNRSKSMEPLWQILTQLGIEPRKKLAESPVAVSIPPKQQPTSVPEPAAPVSTPPVHQENHIVVPREPGVLTSTDPKPAHPRQTELPFRSRSNLEPLEKFLLDQLDESKKMETQKLILDAIRRLSLGSDGRRNIEASLNRLEQKGLIRCGANYVERTFIGSSPQ